MKVLIFSVLSFRAEINEIAYEFDDEIDLTILSNFTDESAIREIRVHGNEECCIDMDSTRRVYKLMLQSDWFLPHIRLILKDFFKIGYLKIFWKQMCTYEQQNGLLGVRPCFTERSSTNFKSKNTQAWPVHQVVSGSEGRWSNVLILPLIRVLSWTLIVHKVVRNGNGCFNTLKSFECDQEPETVLGCDHIQII